VNGYLKGYRLIVWIGILVNLTFAMSAFFFPQFLVDMVGEGRADLFEDPWLFNVGLLLLLNAAFYLPAARDPLRDTLYSWLTAWSRVAAAAAWIVYLLARGAGLPGSFWNIPLSDGVMGVLLVVLLRLGLGGEARPVRT
jgi:hypothetical protein